MREIKFRGLSCYGWYYGVPIRTWFYGSDTMRILPGGEVYGGDFDAMFDITIDEETIGQYTGLKDKNGEEIFEGDIFDFGGNRELVIWKKDSFIVRRYFDSWLGWDVSHEKKDCSLSSFILLDSKIIGNIHENQDLLCSK